MIYIYSIFIGIILGFIFGIIHGPNQNKKKGYSEAVDIPQRNISEKETKESFPKISAIIGIDFGSTFSGYSIIFDPFDNELNIDVNEMISSKIIIHKISQDGLFIGEDASMYFINNLDYLYFKLFKRNLNPKKKRIIVSSDYPGDKIELYIIIKEFLRKMKLKIEENNKRIDKANFTEIKWIITVPPLWDIKGKNLMEKAAKKAQMVNLEILLEPEAVSLAIFNEENPTIKRNIHPGKKFLIVDAGGYTVDFSANKILENNNLEQLMIPTSIVNGSSIINERIFELVEGFIGKNKVEEYKKSNYRIINNILTSIEEKKKEINDNQAGFFKLDISGFDLYCPNDNLLGKAFDKVFGAKSYFAKKECEKEINGQKLIFNNKELFIPKKYVYDIIHQVAVNIQNYINSILAKIGSVDLIVFTGGFSNNIIFRNYIKKNSEGNLAEIAFLENPQMSVMKGAALFGLNPSQIIKRIIPITIGVYSTREKKDNEDTCYGKYINEKYEIRCHDYLQYVQRRQSIDVNKIIRYKIYPIDEKIIIYYTYEKEINEENKAELGYINIPLSVIPLNQRNFILSMKFSNYINVTLTDETLDSENTVLLSYPRNKFF